VLVSGWVAGLRAALVAWILASLAFEYYFTRPFGSFKVDSSEIPELTIFVVVAGLLAVGSAARRRSRAEDARRWFVQSMERVNRATQSSSNLPQMMSNVLDALQADPAGEP